MPLMDLAQIFQVQLRILAYVVLAMILGGAIGFEREAKDKPACALTCWFLEQRPC